MNEFESKFEKVEQFLEEKKYLHAIQILHSLLEAPGLQRKAVLKLIEIYDVQNQVESATKTFDEYFTRFEDDENMKTYYAQFLVRHKKYSEAHDILSTVSSKSRPERNFLMGLANFYLADYEIAVLNFLEFEDQNSKSELLSEAFLYIARCKVKQNELDSALSYLNKSEELSNQNCIIYLTYSEVYYQKKMYFHALENIQKSIQLNPTDMETLELRARIFFKLGEFEKARRDLEFLLIGKNPEAELLALLGYTCLELKDIQMAQEYFKSALELNPEEKSALLGISQCKLI